ncbi:hypothetical protein JXJ21_06695 [candidate division KSB1 bacterium]|nr:hypothetical protein [candidate division KSB1 bacterium]
MYLELLTLAALVLVAAYLCCIDASPVDEAGRPLILKKGTIDCDVVETNPVVFKGKLCRFEYVRQHYWNNTSGGSYFRFIESESGRATPAFARGFHLGCAFVAGDTVYVSAVDIWDGEKIYIFASTDLAHWESWIALHLPGYGLFNTSLCEAAGKYVLMFEVGKPPEVAGVRFTARFATSTDMRHWQLIAPECTYSKDRYTAPHCLRYLDGYFYNFYLEAFEGYETRVVRSKDLIHWESSPRNPVLKASEEDKRIANSQLPPEQIQKIAAAVNINNSDIDFCEFQGKVIINYSWGNQQGVELLAEATYGGSVEQFLKGWFDD